MLPIISGSRPPNQENDLPIDRHFFFAVSQTVPNLNTNTYQTHHKSTLKFHVKFHVQLRKIKPCHVRRPHLVLGVGQPGQLWPWAHLGPASESTFHASVDQERVRCVGDGGFGVDGRWDNDWGIWGECPREPVQSDGEVGWG